MASLHRSTCIPKEHPGDDAYRRDDRATAKTLDASCTPNGGGPEPNKHDASGARGVRISSD